jgi:hypothetical protein
MFCMSLSDITLWATWLSLYMVYIKFFPCVLRYVYLIFECSISQRKFINRGDIIKCGCNSKLLTLLFWQLYGHSSSPLGKEYSLICSHIVAHFSTDSDSGMC